MSRGNVRTFLGVMSQRTKPWPAGRTIAISTPPTLCPTCHPGGAVTYWCPERRQWVGPTTEAPTTAAYAAMPSDEAARVRRHRHRWLGIYDP